MASLISSLLSRQSATVLPRASQYFGSQVRARASTFWRRAFVASGPHFHGRLSRQPFSFHSGASIPSKRISIWPTHKVSPSFTYVTVPTIGSYAKAGNAIVGNATTHKSILVPAAAVNVSALSASMALPLFHRWGWDDD